MPVVGDTLNLTEVECDRVPLNPVTVTLYAPGVPLHAKTDVPEPPEIEDVLSVQVRPVLGETVEFRKTRPVKPFNADTVMVEVPLTPLFTFTVVGLADIVKSGAALNMKVAVAE